MRWYAELLWSGFCWGCDRVCWALLARCHPAIMPRHIAITLYFNLLRRRQVWAGFCWISASPRHGHITTTLYFSLCSPRVCLHTRIQTTTYPNNVQQFSINIPGLEEYYHGMVIFHVHIPPRAMWLGCGTKLLPCHGNISPFQILLSHKLPCLDEYFHGMIIFHVHTPPRVTWLGCGYENNTMSW